MEEKKKILLSIRDLEVKFRVRGRILTAIRNVFNEMYARDTSKKIRATWQSKGKSGEHLSTNPPYGYRKDPENKKKWLVDDEAAAAATIAAVKKLSADVGIPADLKGILKDEDVQFLSDSAFADACRPGNPRDTSVEEIKALYRSMM